MKPIQHIICLLAVYCLTGAAVAQGWTGSLDEGGVVQLDPDTNKATVYSRNGAVPLWDGTHRMQDGSVVIVREGIVTSRSGGGSEPATSPQAMEEPGVVQGSSACVELVIKVCGFNGECSKDTACSPARQLMQLEKDEAWQTRSEGPNLTSAQCRQALENERYFTRCNIKRISDAPTACENLVTRVCGAGNQCSDAPACSPAQQLLAMETQERLASRSASKPTYTAKRCSELLRGSDFFTPCRSQQTPAAGGDAGNEQPATGTQPARPHQ